MKVIIAGSRNITNKLLVTKAITESGFNITEVVSGCARGVDRLGESVAKDNGIPIRQFPANWELYGKSAGAIRNKDMANYADALIAIWDGKSPGTKNMLNIAKKKGLQIHITMVVSEKVL